MARLHFESASIGSVRGSIEVCCLRALQGRTGVIHGHDIRQ